MAEASSTITYESMILCHETVIIALTIASVNNL